MTVEELIERLKKLKQGRLVKIRGPRSGSYRDVDSDFDDRYTYDALKEVEFYEL